LGNNVIALAWADLGLSGSELDKCSQSGAARKQVDSDVDEAKRLGLTGTPTSFVGRRTPAGELLVEVAFSGAQPIDRFREALDASLKQK
jgi:predicted DsbA family dithiol-disulfide isomerase